MVWYFIGVYIINRTLHGRWEIRNFSPPCAENTRREHSKRNFVSLQGHVISSIYAILKPKELFKRSSRYFSKNRLNLNIYQMQSVNRIQSVSSEITKLVLKNSAIKNNKVRHFQLQFSCFHHRQPKLMLQEKGVK